MALVKTVTLSHLSSELPVHIALFKDVKNSAFLRQQLLAGNAEFEYAFIDASLIISTSHALAATFRALNDLLARRLRSRNVHSEIVFSLSVNNNIAESFRRFGVVDATTSLLAIKVSTSENPVTAESVAAHLTEHVQGTAIEFSDDVMAGLTDWPAVRKAYKLNASKAAAHKGGKNKAAAVNGAVKDEGEVVEDERKYAEAVALSMMALKGS